ncbi:MAG: aminoacyl-tRNA hydrolase [Candidatus Pacebacteria bacterium]|nr:aminoacyl-tRNA hydrolase [Candidatus Paceibacterota bacterium]
MKFIFGLGNPGLDYSQTRHNAGQMLIDYLAKQLGDGWKSQSKLKAEVMKAGELILAKPTTFMNQSGQAIRAVLDYYASFSGPACREQLKNVYLAHDDLDMELGSWKLQFGTGPRQHNGLLSAYQHLGTDQVWHIRIGIDTRQGDRTQPAKNYVLQKMSAFEQKQLEASFSQIKRQLAKEQIII